MSDFESGQATQVRLLPGEHHSRSGTVSVSDSTGPEGAKCAQRGAQTVAERSAALSARLSDADAYERSMPLYFLIGCARSAADHGDDSLLRQIEQAFAHTLPVAGATR